MLHHTFSNFKNSLKKGVDFVKTVTIGTITSIKDDICEEISLRKEVKELRKARNSSESSEKSE